MTEQNGLHRIRRALISVSDKTNIIEFAQALVQRGVEVISTGGTAKHLRSAGIELRDVADVTGFPEMMDGRVKTLHPRIHGGILAVRDNPNHLAAMRDNGIEPIDIVVINLYPFVETISQPDTTLAEAIEQIDIGGPALIRSAAKNFSSVAVVTNPSQYASVIEELNQADGALSLSTRRQLARDAFLATTSYDRSIHGYLANEAATSSNENFPAQQSLRLHKLTDLRYGENPHQQAALYALDQDRSGSPIATAEVLSGKEMSYNNYLDTDAAWAVVSDFASLTCAIIKHTNPAGVGQGFSAEEAYRRALATDPISAFGGIVAFNCQVDEDAARAVVDIFTEVVVAPDFEPAALEVLKTKSKLRLLRTGGVGRNDAFQYRQISGGMLAQTADKHGLKPGDLKVVSQRAPTEEEMEALQFAWTVAKHTKSNAIVYARKGQTVGVGAGQMSRVDSVKLGATRAQLPVKDSVLASDAFFPFRDGIDEAAKHGITAVIQPGGSVKDADVIEAVNEHNLAMVFTGVRHFKH